MEKTDDNFTFGKLIYAYDEFKNNPNSKLFSMIEKNLKKLSELNILLEKNVMEDIEKFLVEIEYVSFIPSDKPIRKDGSKNAIKYTQFELNKLPLGVDSEQKGSRKVTSSDNFYFGDSIMIIEGYPLIYDSLWDWFINHGGMEATRKWVQYENTIQDDIVFPKVYGFKQVLIKALSYYDDERLETNTGDIYYKDPPIMQEPNDLFSINNKPAFINLLIEEGYIDTDCRALTSLDDIAEKLLTEIEIVKPQLLVHYIRQPDGSRYSLRTAQDAIQRNKTH